MVLPACVAGPTGSVFLFEPAHHCCNADLAHCRYERLVSSVSVGPPGRERGEVVHRAQPVVGGWRKCPAQPAEVDPLEVMRPSVIERVVEVEPVDEGTHAHVVPQKKTPVDRGPRAPPGRARREEAPSSMCPSSGPRQDGRVPVGTLHQHFATRYRIVPHARSRGRRSGTDPAPAKVPLWPCAVAVRLLGLPLRVADASARSATPHAGRRARSRCSLSLVAGLGAAT